MCGVILNYIDTKDRTSNSEKNKKIAYFKG